MKGIAFVTSTLPLPAIHGAMELWQIDEVVVLGKTLSKSYLYLQKKFPDLRVTTVPNSLSLEALYIFCRLYVCKLQNREVFFFHECCWIIFDLAINFIKPRAHFYPQVTMKSFRKMPKDFIYKGKSKQATLLKHISKEECFDLYEMLLDSGSGVDYLWSCNEYNARVLIHNIEESSNFKNIVNMGGGRRIKKRAVDNSARLGRRSSFSKTLFRYRE